MSDSNVNAKILLPAERNLVGGTRDKRESLQKRQTIKSAGTLLSLLRLCIITLKAALFGKLNAHILCFMLLKLRAHQGGFTQQLAASHQVSNGDVKVRVAAAPVGDLGERVSDEDVLQEILISRIRE